MLHLVFAIIALKFF